MITLHCPAKINLFLAIGEKESNGYHSIETVLLRTDLLADRIHVEEADELTLECPPELPTNQDNSILKAIRVMEEASQQKITYKLRLEKNIPIAAGLGGGSSDAAAIMIFINENQQLGFSHDQLLELGAKVGMDVPFFISGYRLAHGTHYGEILKELPSLPEEIHFKIHPNSKKQSTQDAYKDWDESGQKSTADIQELLIAIQNKDSKKIIAKLHNDFELIQNLPPRPEHAAGWILAGSGAACIAVYVQNKTQPKSQE